MTNTITGLDGAHELLIKLVDQAPDDWAMRKKVAQVLFDASYYRDASQMIWSAPEIPPVGEDVVFSARVVARGQPTRAMRLINTVIEKNLGNPEENLAMAKLFLKADMRLQAIRFYGAAVALDASLIDEHFEIRLLKADAESLSWSEEVMSEDFPWDGPELPEETEDGEADEDAHIALLNGLTQPVPIKAPLSETKRQVAKSEPAESGSKEKEVKLEKEDLEPEPAEPEAEQAESEPKLEEAKPERKLPVWKVQEGRAIFDPTKKKEEEAEKAEETEETVESLDEVEIKKPEVKLPTAKVELPPAKVELKAVEVSESEEVEVDEEIQIESVKETTESSDEKQQSEALEETAPVAETAEVEESEEAVSESETDAQPAFFKSYDDAHQHKDEVEPSEAKDELPSEATAPVSVEVKEEVFKTEPAQNEGGDLDDYVAEAMAEYESSAHEEEEKPQEGGVVGALSSLVNRFRKKKTEEKPEQLENVELSDDQAEPEQVAAAPVLVKTEPVQIQAEKSEASVEEPVSLAQEETPAPAPEAVAEPASEPAPEPVAEQKPVELSVTEVKPTPLTRPGVHTSAQKLVQQTQTTENEEPRELDGRTQLVALAPEDGAAYFEQLVAKYSNIPDGQVPRAVAVARDMANADYLKLIHKACEKDLDAFSKLLGLHRAMAANQCSDWGEDMNLLRKGYGDAVLATVVSKYSVSECREILNSVYQHPAPAAAV